MQRDTNGPFKPVAYASRTLSASERRYAQIEKEAVAIAWGCDKFSNFIVGKTITIETDHKPLVSIFGQKDLDTLTPRLQRIKMRLMRYSFEIKYTPGKNLIIADTLSRGPLKTEESQELAEEITAYVQSIIAGFPSTDERLVEILKGQQEDPVCCELAKYCTEGWPARHKISQECIPYWEHRNLITLQEGLLMKSSRLIIPQCLRKSILDKIHSGHQGINKCRALARQSVWWPGLSIQIEQLIKNCVSCIKHEPDQTEPLMPSEFPKRPWQIVGTDLLKLEGNWYVIVSDYYSRYVEVAKLERQTSQSIIMHHKSIFARHGIPEVVRSDNGSQFSQTIDSAYHQFAKNYGFQLVTSSPKYSQSNGFIESEVKNFKKHFKKSDDPHKMLLALRSTPLQSGYSPAELLMGRKLRGVVPLASNLLNPALPNQKVLCQKENLRREKQKENFDIRHRSSLLPELMIGQKVWISDLRQEGCVESKHKSPRSYVVKSPKGIYRRNRKFLHPLPGVSEETYEEPAETETKELLLDTPNITEPNVKIESQMETPEVQSPVRETLRRSNRQVRAPKRLDL